MNFRLWMYDFRLYRILLRRFGISSIVACKRLPEVIIKSLDDVGVHLRDMHLKLHLDKFQNPLILRYQSSDAKVFMQIFVEEEYSCLKGIGNINFVVDAGANVGYSSIYLLGLFPDAHIVAVEPDDNNMKICRENLAPYQSRVSMLDSAIWSRKTGLVFSKEDYRDGRGWSIRVEEADKDITPDLYATDIESILRDSGYPSIDLLKMDIERSEIEVFSNNYKYWLDRTKNIVIELHDPECESVFFSAMSDYNYELQKSGELAVCLNISPKS
jgi:FkbM family methyltransferase